MAKIGKVVINPHYATAAGAALIRWTLPPFLYVLWCCRGRERMTTIIIIRLDFHIAVGLQTSPVSPTYRQAGNDLCIDWQFVSLCHQIEELLLLLFLLLFQSIKNTIGKKNQSIIITNLSSSPTHSITPPFLVLLLLLSSK